MQTVEVVHPFVREAAARFRYEIDLYRNRSWVGSCIVEDQCIVDCRVIQLGATGAETDRILTRIQAALASGESSVNLGGDHFGWQLSTSSALKAELSLRWDGAASRAAFGRAILAWRP